MEASRAGGLEERKLGRRPIGNQISLFLLLCSVGCRDSIKASKGYTQRPFRFTVSVLEQRRFTRRIIGSKTPLMYFGILLVDKQTYNPLTHFACSRRHRDIQRCCKSFFIKAFVCHSELAFVDQEKRKVQAFQA